MSCVLEILSSDILQDDFTKCFAPYLFVQSILGTNRVDIRNRFVTNTTRCQKLYAFLFSLCVTSSALYFNNFYMNFLKDNFILYIIYGLGIFLQFVCYALNVVQVKFFRPSNNIKLYLILQKIDRILRLDGFTFLNDRQFVLNLLGVSSITIGYTIGFWIHVYSNVEKPLYTMFLSLGIITVYIELLVMESQIYFLATRLRFLNQLVNTHLNNDKSLKPSEFHGVFKLIWPHDERFQLIASSAIFKNKADTFKRMITCVKYIIEGSNIIGYIYSFQITILLGVVFVWTLLVIEGLILGFGTKWMPLSTAVTMILWLFFYAFEIILMATTSELFLLQFRDTKKLCSNILINNCEGGIHDTAKALLRTIAWHSPEFSVYGIFSVDKQLPLKLLGLITANVVVLLQFTFL